MKVNKETLNSGVKVFVCSRMLNSTEVMMMIHPAPLHHSAHKVTVSVQLQLQVRGHFLLII